VRQRRSCRRTVFGLRPGLPDYLHADKNQSVFCSFRLKILSNGAGKWAEKIEGAKMQSQLSVRHPRM
jgi:hypothetical protein